jgi:hypothetical protein
VILPEHWRCVRRVGPGSEAAFPVSFAKPLATERMAGISSVLACADKRDRPGSSWFEVFAGRRSGLRGAWRSNPSSAARLPRRSGRDEADKEHLAPEERAGVQQCRCSESGRAGTENPIRLHDIPTLLALLRCCGNSNPRDRQVYKSSQSDV